MTGNILHTQQTERILRCAFATCLAVVLLSSELALAGDDPPEKPTAPASAAAPKNAKSGAGHSKKKSPDHLVRLNFVAASWPHVLERVAKQSGLTLVMKRAPNGKFTRTDRKKYPIQEAIRVLNRELEPLGYRVVHQNDFLVVLELNDLRSEYTRPLVQSSTDDKAKNDKATEEYACKVETLSSPAKSAIAANRDEDKTMPGRRDLAETGSSPEDQTSALRHTAVNSGDEADKPAAVALTDTRERREKVPQRPEETRVGSSTVMLHRGRAVIAARRLYAGLKSRSELIDEGPEGLPGLVVHAINRADSSARRRAASPQLTAVAFTIGIDVDHNRLVVEGTRARRSAVAHVLEVLDAAEDSSAAPVHLVSAEPEGCAIAQALSPELDRLIAQRNAQGETAQDDSAKAGGRPAPGAAVLPMSNDKDISEIIKGLKGDVSVESVPELGILILRGGQSDVDAVMKVIREIERLSAGAAPQIHFHPLKNVNSESMTTLLTEVYKELAGQRTGEKEAKQAIKIFAVVKPNAVLILAPPADMPGILKLINQLDMPVESAMEFQIFRLRNGIATQVAKAVTDFFKDRKGLGTKVVAIPDPRTNSVIASAQGRDLAEVGRVIEQLDAPTAAAAVIKVFALENGDATAIERLLATMFATQRAGAAGAAGGVGGVAPGQTAGAEGANQATAPIRFSVDVRTNSIIAMGPAETLRAIEAIILRLDNSKAHERETVVIRLKNNGSDAVQRAVDTFVRSQRELAQIDPDLLSNVELLEREVFVVSEPVSNSLLLSSTPRYFSELKRMIDRLDAPPAQVIIQALIVEVELDNTDEFGIELGFQTPTIFQRSQLSNQVFQTQTISPIGQPQVTSQNIISQQADPGFQFGNPINGLGLNPISPATVGTQELSSLGVGRISNALGVSGLVLAASSESVSALLRALSYKETIHILSRPQIRTVDNLPATIQVGQRVPIVTGANANGVGSLSPIINYDSAGIILTVQPRIDTDGMIVLHAYAEKSSYNLTSGQGVTLVTDSATGRTITSPIKNITRAETTVSLATGNTVVMGGMITSNDDATTYKVPWVGDLPVVGQLFRYDTRSTKRTELLIFLTPRLIRNDADDEMIKQIETERMHFIVEEAEAIHGPILSCNPALLHDEVKPQSPAVPPAPPRGPIVPPPPGTYPMAPTLEAPANPPPAAMPPATRRDGKRVPTGLVEMKVIRQKGSGSNSEATVNTVSDERSASRVAPERADESQKAPTAPAESNSNP
jgi:type II secretion system protein D